MRGALVGCFTLCGILSAFGGALIAGRSLNAYQAKGDPYLLPAIAAVVLGGTNILGGRGDYRGDVADLWAGGRGRRGERSTIVSSLWGLPWLEQDPALVALLTQPTREAHAMVPASAVVPAFGEPIPSAN